MSESEQKEILKRIAERGRDHAYKCHTGRWAEPPMYPWKSQIDLWQHILDEIERLHSDD